MSLIVALVGFGVGIWQLVRTANATVATRDALVRSSKTQFLFLLPQFRQLEIELDIAVSTNERQLAARSLSSYAHLANEVAALIEELQLAEKDVISDVRTAATMASDAKSDIYGSRKRSLSAITASFRQSTTTVSEHVSRLRSSESMKELRGAGGN